MGEKDEEGTSQYPPEIKSLFSGVRDIMIPVSLSFFSPIPELKFSNIFQVKMRPLLQVLLVSSRWIPFLNSHLFDAISATFVGQASFERMGY